jgi:hypothetical protein
VKNRIAGLVRFIWGELDTVIELFAYLGIAKAISVVFGVSFYLSMVIVLIFFLVCLLRILVEKTRK